MPDFISPDEDLEASLGGPRRSPARQTAEAGSDVRDRSVFGAETFQQSMAAEGFPTVVPDVDMGRRDTETSPSLAPRPVVIRRRQKEGSGAA